MPDNAPERHPHARRFAFLGLLLALMLGASLAALVNGPFKVELREIISALLVGPNLDQPRDQDPRGQTVHALMWAIRLPRVCAGLVIGAGLAACGAAMQGMFRNPLADPGLIGVSAGAGLGAVIMIVFGTLVSASLPLWLSGSLVPVGAFVGAALTTLIIYRLSLVEGRVQVATMLLAGIAINSMVGAAMGYMLTLATDDQLRTITFWTLGSLAQVSWPELRIAAPIILTVVIVLPFFAKALNSMLLGDVEATRLGVRADIVKRVLIALTALAVGAAVASAGAIGFLGLVVPHLVRLCIGPDHRFLLPASALMGAALLVLSDLFARTVAAPAELPIGMITAAIGAPFFLFLLSYQRKSLFL